MSIINKQNIDDKTIAMLYRTISHLNQQVDHYENLFNHAMKKRIEAEELTKAYQELAEALEKRNEKNKELCENLKNQLENQRELQTVLLEERKCMHELIEKMKLH